MKSRAGELLQRAKVLSEAEGEVANLRKRLAHQEQLYAEEKERHEAAKEQVTAKVRQMEQLMKQLIEERNRLAARLQQRPVTRCIATQTEVEVHVLPRNVVDVAVDATQSASSSLRNAADIPPPERSPPVSLERRSPVALLSSEILRRCECLLHVELMQSTVSVATCNRNTGLWEWVHRPRESFTTDDKVDIALAAVSSRCGTRGVAETVAMLTGQRPTEAIRWSDFDMAWTCEALRAYSIIMLLRTIRGEEMIVSDVAALGSDFLFLVTVVDGTQLTASWKPFDWLLLQSDTVQYFNTPSTGLQDLRIVTSFDSQGRAACGIRWKGNPPTDLVAQLCVHVDSASEDSLPEASLVPLGKVYVILCPELLRAEPTPISAVVSLTFRTRCSLPPLQLTTAPVEDPFDGSVHCAPTIVPFQIDAIDQLNSIVHFTPVVGKEFSAAALFSPMRSNNDAATCDVGVNTASSQYVVDEDFRLKRQEAVLKEMRDLENEFGEVEFAALHRCSQWLDGQCEALFEHFRALAGLAMRTFDLNVFRGAYRQLSRWMTSSQRIFSAHHSASSDVFIEVVTEARSLATLQATQTQTLSASFAVWWAQFTDEYESFLFQKTTAFAEEAPKMALSTTSADILFPGEGELIHHLYSFAGSMEEIVGDVFSRCKLVVELILQRNMTFVHGVITTLDDRDELIDTLEARLVRPATSDVAVNARTNAGDVSRWSSERLQLTLQMSTLQTYVSDLVTERNELLVYKRRMDTESASVQFHIESLNDRCEALAQECEALSQKLSASADREKAQQLRLNDFHAQIEGLQESLYEARAELTRYEASKFVNVRRLEEEVAAKSTRVEELSMEIELLREALSNRENDYRASSAGDSFADANRTNKLDILPPTSQRSKPWAEPPKRVPKQEPLAAPNIPQNASFRLPRKAKGAGESNVVAVGDGPSINFTPSSPQSVALSPAPTEASGLVRKTSLLRVKR